MKKELIKNKIFALGMIAGGIAILIASKDATILLLSVLFGVPLFVAKRNYIDWADNGSFFIFCQNHRKNEALFCVLSDFI